MVNLIPKYLIIVVNIVMKLNIMKTMERISRNNPGMSKSNVKPYPQILDYCSLCIVNLSCLD